MQQSRKTVTETLEHLQFLLRLCACKANLGEQSKFCHPMGVAPDNMHTFRELKTLHHLEEKPRLPLQYYSSQAHQFDEPTVFGQLYLATQPKSHLRNGRFHRMQKSYRSILKNAFNSIKSSNSNCIYHINAESCIICHLLLLTAQSSLL